jgi:hypothetical protein
MFEFIITKDDSAEKVSDSKQDTSLLSFKAWVLNLIQI